ncbi:CPBP family intramembrane glutamic endopeptidase [Agromyces archimandritae]|uniref:CPBP family intramembrane metalloprotease n=1 Tax=Agromyces archimandritae TaxID=2781962 RepID=A0A975IMX9_9MICO|nr:CPBP family intramembrane glutamic endopeptidase [Agromyces archimandritae]QTX03950.1 CPBP family intramembrane metalloprotease [Agromyces archimandritae]
MIPAPDSAQQVPAPRPFVPQRPSRPAWLGPLVFSALAIALAWLVASPLFVTGGLASPVFPLIAMLVMLTPGASALITVRFVEGRRGVWRALGAWPLRPVGRLFAWLGIALGVCLALVFAALPLGVLFGVYEADFAGFGFFAEQITAQLAASGAGGFPLPIALLVGLQLAMIVPGSLVNMLPAFGEELGWRGYLYPSLRRLGVVPAILVSGVIWGVWHAPLLLLGYNYPGVDPLVAIASMCGMCIVMGGVLAWVRERSGSVLPAALGHGAINASAGTVFLFAAAGSSVDPTQAGLLGWSGWIVPLVLVAVLVATGLFRGPREQRPGADAAQPASGGAGEAAAVGSDA